MLTNSNVADLTMRSPSYGAGSLITWKCLGCHQPRIYLGSKGVGVRKRCKQCLDAKAKAGQP